MATRITAPVEGFRGKVGGVEFKDSVAITDDEAVIAYCRAAGYKVEPVKAAAPKAETKPSAKK